MYFHLNLRKVWSTYLAFRGLAFIVVYPAVLSIIPALISDSAAKGAFILLLMAGYWLTEVIPIYVTALLPIVLGPLFGLVTSSQVCQAYMKDTNMLFIGGLFVATAIEHRGLHKRIALSVLRVVGSDPKMLMLGFMLPTWFLSMWMSNTATTAMMITIVEAVLQSLASVEQTLHEAEENDSRREAEIPIPEFLNQAMKAIPKNAPVLNSKKNHRHLHEALTIGITAVHSEEHKTHNSREFAELQAMKKLGVALSLSICYSSTCGGIATITGTAPNSILFGLVNSLYGPSTGLTFGSWMAYATPISLVMLALTWIWLTVLWFGLRCDNSRGSKRDRLVKEVIERESKALGKFTYGEGFCCILFLLITFLWITRNVGSAGWSRFFNTSDEIYVTDTQPAILVSLIALILPAVGPLKLWRYQYHHYEDPTVSVDFANQFLLPWHVAQSRIPWGVVFVLGGGFALSDICQSSGLSAAVGNYLGIHLAHIPVMGLILICSICAACLTELTSNAATASILLPIMFSLSTSIGIHPFMLALPTTIGTSFAFSLPAATPPNSIVFGKGRVQVKQMLKSGIVLNLLGSVVSLFAMATYAQPLFSMHQVPDWIGNTSNPVTFVH